MRLQEEKKQEEIKGKGRSIQDSEKMLKWLPL